MPKGQMGTLAKNEAGKRYGKITVIRRVEGYKWKAVWLCKCDCGTEKEIPAKNLRRAANPTRSCGICVRRKKRVTGINTKNELGNRYGKLVVINRASNKTSKNGKSVDAQWECLCDCGNKKVVMATNLRSGSSTSCGCSKIRPHGEASFHSLYLRLRYMAMKRSREWGLSKDRVREITSSACFYCGTQPNQIAGSGKKSNGYYIYNGIDRVNNDRGYFVDNVVPCCKHCNTSKNIFSAQEFKEYIIMVYNHWANSS